MNIYLQKIQEIALPNKYTKWYTSLIISCLIREKPSVYIEKHHIVPKCCKLGGETDRNNLVCFTAREHFIAHKMLTKMFEGTLKGKMYFALASLRLSNKDKRQFNSKQYEQFKKAWSIAIKTRVYTPEQLERYRLERIKQKGIKKKPHTEETKQLLREQSTGRVASEETREKLRKKQLGKYLSAETKFKISQTRLNGPKQIISPEGLEIIRNTASKTHKNRKRPPETCAKIKEVQKGFRWVTNGTNNKRIKEGNPLPIGYFPGRIIDW